MAFLANFGEAKIFVPAFELDKTTVPCAAFVLDVHDPKADSLAIAVLHQLGVCPRSGACNVRQLSPLPADNRLELAQYW